MHKFLSYLDCEVHSPRRHASWIHFPLPSILQLQLLLGSVSMSSVWVIHQEYVVPCDIFCMGNPPGVYGSQGLYMVARDCTFILCMGYPPGLCRLSIQTILSLPTKFLLGFIHSEDFHSLAFLQFFSIQSVLQLLPRSVSFLLRLTLRNPNLLLYTFLNRTTSSLWFVNTDTVHTHLYLLPSVALEE